MVSSGVGLSGHCNSTCVVWEVTSSTQFHGAESGFQQRYNLTGSIYFPKQYFMLLLLI